MYSYAPSRSTVDVYTKYYQNQAGFGDGQSVQTYRGSAYQRGYGIGSIFSSIWKGITPLFQSSAVREAARSVGSKLLNTGLQVGSDLLQGQNLKDSAKSRFKQVGSELLDDMAGSLRQSGGGRKRRGRKKKKSGSVTFLKNKKQMMKKLLALNLKTKRKSRKKKSKKKKKKGGKKRRSRKKKDIFTE
jgi:hypothetical protein